MSLKAQYYDHLCSHYTLDRSALQSHHMDSLTTVMLTTSNCSSLSPHPRPTPTLCRASPLGQLRITSNSTLVKLNSSSSWGKTALAWTCQSLLRMRIQMMLLDLKAVNRTAPVYLQTLGRPHAPERVLHSSTSAGWLVPPSLRANKTHSAKLRLFSVLAPQQWNKLPTNVRTAESLAILSKRLKTPLFRLLDPA